MPPSIRVGSRTYGHVETLKHDFFAATGLYRGPAGKAVLKVMRQSPLLGFPLKGVGGLLKRNETRMCRLAESIEGVPRIIGPWGPTGLVREYVEGRPLAREDVPDDRFFPQLAAILSQIHARDAAYVDLEKRENILVGADGAPYLIDFQISWHLSQTRGGRTWLARLILDILQDSDRFHLLKHWRRHRPDQLQGEEIDDSYKAPSWIKWHRVVFRPLTRLRRQMLVRLGARASASGRSPG